MTNRGDSDATTRGTAAETVLAKYVSQLPVDQPDWKLYAGKLWFELAILQRITNFFLEKMDFSASRSATRAYIESLAPENLAMARGEKLLTEAAGSLRDGRANFVLGMLYQEYGNSAKALRQFSEAAVRSPGAVRAKYQAGILHLERGAKVEAVRLFESAVAITAGFVDARRALATLRREEAPTEGARHFAMLMQYGPALDYDYRMLSTRDDNLEIVAGGYKGYDVFRVGDTYYVVPIQMGEVTAASLSRARSRLLHRGFFIRQIARMDSLRATPAAAARASIGAPVLMPLRQVYLAGGRATASARWILIIGRRRLKRAVARGVRRLARSRRLAPSFLRPAVAMLERQWANRIVRLRAFAGATLQEVISEIDLRTSAIQIVEENYRGYDIVRWRGYVFAVSRKHGRLAPLDLHWAYLLMLQGRRTGSIMVGRTHTELKQKLNGVRDGPSLLRGAG